MENLKEALETAMRMEKEGIEFYSKAGKQTTHPMGKQMFLSFVEDEKEHLRILKNLAAEILSKEDLAYLQTKGPKGRLKTAFQQNKSEVKEALASNPDDIQALKIAINMETEGYKYYKETAAQTSDADIKALLLRLGKDENDHFEILQNTLTFLVSSGDWFLWEERGLLDGA